MGINFKETKSGAVGEIIYPAYNGTNGFWKKSRWDLIVKVDKKGSVVHIFCIWDFATVKAIQLMQELIKRGAFN